MSPEVHKSFLIENSNITNEKTARSVEVGNRVKPGNP